ncbi:restriction endonuclease subunit S [Ellagibacter sp.]|uniref:restriction endonuclease subunit S n=1 Tax=Ellagibacter sp. TaxID=2137578 RepID=UPI003AB7F6B7
MSIKLKDLCELIVDCPHSTEPDEGQGYPIIRTPNIGPGYLNLDGVQRVGEEAYKRRNVRAVPQSGDLILAREAPAGNVGIIPDGEKVCLGQRTVLIRPDRSKADPAYLNYYLNAPKQRHKLLSNSNGATVSHVNMPIIHNLPVDLPPLPVQSRNAGVLSAYDKLIENNRRQIKLLEEAAQRLYKEWFVDLRFPGHETTPIHNGVPEGWAKGSLLDLADVVRGCSYSSDQIVAGNRTLINLGNLTPFGGFRFGYEKPFSGKARPDQTVCQGDVVMGLTEQATGLAGYAALLPCVPTDSVISADLVKLSPREGVPRLFVYALLQYGRLSALISPLANGTKIKHLRPESLPRAVALLPATALMKRYAEVVKPMFDKIALAQQQIVAAREARDRLLPKLMSGEIEV